MHIVSRPIQVLPDDLAQKIAAGEVIERPASVIKELVENAIDAQASSIEVEIEDGGKKRILVLDNGCGIPDDETLTALKRHATSKITQLDDLWNIQTMGFRGEALPSIATVSRFTLETRAQKNQGKKVYLEGGKNPVSSSLESTSRVLVAHTGTFIQVEDLFYNVPARLKFLKSRHSESLHIRELLERLALVHPQIHFSLKSEQRKTLDLKLAQGLGDDQRLLRFSEILETQPQEIEPFFLTYEDIRVEGLFDRNIRANNSRYIFLCINNRMVRDRLLQQAVITALRPIMMEGEYPRIFLSIQVPPHALDVNVHPAKLEVRFHKPRDVFQTIHAALSTIVRKPTSTGYLLPEKQQLAEIKSQMGDGLLGVELEHGDQSQPGFKWQQTNIDTFHGAPQPQIDAEGRDQTQHTPVQLEAKHSSFSSLRYIGQVNNTYLLFQDVGHLIVIDQHAAHERINYEKIKSRFLKEGLKPQPLLLSITVKAKLEEIALAVDYAELFLKLGFEVEVFGDSCLIIRSTPEGLSTDQSIPLFQTLIQELKELESISLKADDPSLFSPKLDRILSTTACHSSIRAGQLLSAVQAHALACEMETTTSSLNCPHGRPSSIRIPFERLDDWFKR